MPTLSACGGLHPLALQQHLHQGVLQAEHPDRAGHPATAGQQTERHLGYAELDPVVVGNDPVVAGERDLQAAAERSAVDRGNDRDAQRLQPRGAARLTSSIVSKTSAAFVRLDPRQHLQVAAGEEGLLGAGDHDAGVGVLLGLQALDRRPIAAR